MLVPSYLGSWRIVSFRFLCPEFRYHSTPSGTINQSPTGCFHHIWFLLVGGPLARFEVKVSRHHVAPARLTSQVYYSGFGCCWRQFVSLVDRQTVVCVILCLLPPHVGRSVALVRWLVSRRPSVGYRPYLLIQFSVLVIILTCPTSRLRWQFMVIVRDLWLCESDVRCDV